MEVTRQWFYWDGEGEHREQVFTDDRISAEGTIFLCTDDLVDGTEFGLAVTLTEVVDSPSNFMLESVERAMDEYREEHDS